jgi:hypothetical protein
MPTRTISLKVEAYERLKAAKRYEGESFSDVVLRATWPELAVSAGELLSLCRERGPTFTAGELDGIDELKRSDKPPEEKWPKT